ncbi:hypothetical protein KKJ24_19520 [Xenorhabdus bovienii]|nr:hypothetical protein [Xenorhabdus bovienii]
MSTILHDCTLFKGSPLRGLHGAEMAARERARSLRLRAGRSKSQRGWGGGGKNGGRRPTCLQFA